MKDNTEINNLKNLINSNNRKKEKTEEIINYFKILYQKLSYNGYTKKSFEDIIDNNVSRMQFLVEAANIAIYKTNNKELQNIILQSFDILYNYMTGKNELQELEIPQELANSISNDYMPDDTEITYLLTLISSNNKIFENEFKGKDFSQLLHYGFHKNIKEILTIDKDNLPHLLGLTSNGNSMYALYKKNIIDYIIKQIIISLKCKYEDIFDNNNNLKNNNLGNKFNKIFKNLFKLEYNKTNYIKIINSKYNSENKDYETEILNQICNIIPKSSTIEYYTNNNNANNIITEIRKNNEFVTQYIYNNKILKNINDKKFLKKFYSEEEIKLLKTEFNSLTYNSKLNLINKYLKEYKISDDKNFQKEFIEHFNYPYPLLEFNKLIEKNINFYNFSLFENLNSIIVDFETHSSIHSDLFLVSYSKKRRIEERKKIEKEIKEDQNKHKDATNENDNLDKNYINLLKSLLQFPPQERYYFRQMDKIEKNREKMIMENNFSKDNNISMIGFSSDNKEKEKLKKLSENEYGTLNGFDHYHHCETNISTNYYEYYTKWKKNGFEYPIDYIIEDNTGNIKKLSRINEEIETKINIFNNYKYDTNNILESIKYEKEIIINIKDLIYNYNELATIKLNIMKTKYNKNNNYIDNEENNIKIYNNYYNDIEKYFNNYLNIIEENEKTYKTKK